MTLATRELSLVYGTYTIGGSSGNELTGIIINTKKFEEATVEVTWDIKATSEAAFATAISTAETAFSKPFQDLTITQGSQTLYSYKQSSNTGLDARPEITKREDNASGRSRRYTATITVGLPANTGAELVTGLREHSVDVSYDEARIRTITISGMFTAAGSSNGRAQYEAQIDALESSVFGALGIAASSRELVEEPESEHSYNTKTIEFRRVWKELIFSQAGGGLNNTSIVNQNLQISRLKEAPGDTPGAKRLITVSVMYECAVNSESSTNLKGLYEGTIRSFMITQAKSFMGSSVAAVVEEEPRIDPDVNRIQARMTIKGASGSKGSVIERSIEIEDSSTFGHVLVPAWSGDRYSKYHYQGPGKIERTVRDTKTVLGHIYTTPSEMGDPSSLTSIISAVKSPAPDMKVKHISSRPQFIHKRMGIAGLGQHVDVTDVVKVDVFEYYKELPSSDPPIGDNSVRSPR